MNGKRRSSRWRWALVAMMWLGVSAACGPAPPPPETPPEPPRAPAPVVVGGESQHLVFRFISPETGQVVSAGSVADIPPGARGEVIVFDPQAPTPPGWEHVVDVNGGLPSTSTPRQAFVLRPRATGVGTPAQRAPARGQGDVVMFTTRHCPHCTRARRFFKSRKIPFSEYDVESDPKAGSRMQKLAQAAGVPMARLQGVPILFINGEALAGFNEAAVKRALGL